MHSHRYRIVPMLAIIALGLSALSLRGAGSTPCITVLRQAFTHTLIATGRVNIPGTAPLSAGVAGTIDHISVDTGSRVRNGQALISLNARQSRAEVQQARTAVAVAEARLQHLERVLSPLARERLAQAALRRQQAARMLDDAETLADSGGISRDMLLRYREAMVLHGSETSAARLQADADSPGGHGHRVLQAELEQARAAEALARRRAALRIVRAPDAGIIGRRWVDPGQGVQIGTPLLEFIPAALPRLEVRVEEKHLRFLRMGQPASVRPDAYLDAVLSAHVARLSPGIEHPRGTLTVELNVKDPRQLLRDGMTVTVEIRLNHYPAALVIPRSAVRDADTGHPWVWRVIDGKSRRVEVTLGAQSDGRVQITDGLSAGDVIVDAPSLALQEGQSVRAHTP